jgi:hypothetical protein
MSEYPKILDATLSCTVRSTVRLHICITTPQLDHHDHPPLSVILVAVSYEDDLAHQLHDMI